MSGIIHLVSDVRQAWGYAKYPLTGVTPTGVAGRLVYGGYSQTGQMEQARTELSIAIEMYRDMEMTFWVPETEAALAEYGKRRKRGES